MKVGALRNITISNIRATVATADKVRSGIMITGIPGHKVSGIRLDNIVIRFPGMGPADSVSRNVPEDEKRYPEQFFFGSLPSYGMFIRHAENVELTEIQFSYSGEEKRPAFVLEDVNGFALRDSNLQADGIAVLETADSSEMWLSNCKVTGLPNCLIQASANELEQISQSGNCLPKNTKAISCKK